ncbi:MAG: hypothetical protein AB7G76_11615 [Steroidobacteraceae bacterium]
MYSRDRAASWRGATSPFGTRSGDSLIYGQDPQAITDELAGAVKAHFGETGLVALIEALGVIDGRIRLAMMLGALLPREGTHG